MNLENLRHEDTLTKSEIEQLWLQEAVRRAEKMDSRFKLSDFYGN